MRLQIARVVLCCSVVAACGSNDAISERNDASVPMPTRSGRSAATTTTGPTPTNTPSTTGQSSATNNTSAPQPPPAGTATATQPPPPTTAAPTDQPSTSGPISLIADIPCGEPIPIETMPSGQTTTQRMIDGNEVLWSSGDPNGPGDNIVIERIGAANDADVAEARQSNSTFSNGPLTVSLLPSTSVSDAADLYVFDDTNDCVRLINVSPFVPDDVLDQYARTLLASWTTN